MSGDPHADGGPPTHVADGADAPSNAERVRTLLAASTDGALSTIAREPAGHPFGSVVTFVVDDRGCPLVLMSTMAEHARNLDADDRASLLVTAGGDGAGRLAAARATLTGPCRRVPDDEQETATAAYRAGHPDAFWADFPDFFVARLEPVSIRWVRGFGEMGWVDVDEYPDAVPDPVAPAEAGIVEHMNDDHADALVEITVHELGLVDVASVTQLSCDRYGFEVRIIHDDERVAFGRIGFDEVLDDAADARGAMVRLTRAARAGG